MDEDVPEETLINKTVTRIASHVRRGLLSFGQHGVRIRDATGSRPPDYNLSHAPSKCERKEARDISGRAREQRRAVRLLIDSGVGDGFEYFARAGQSVMRLEAAGIGLAATTDIVITHLHMDHVGGLNVDGVKVKLRQDVRIHVSATEMEFWKNPDFSKTVMPETVPPALRKAAAKFVELCSEKIVQFDQTVEVAAGVSARVTGGHTPGHCVVEIA